MLALTTQNPEDTRELGASLGKLLAPGDLVCLEGELGAGKTTLVQGIAHGWGSADQVTSPTFVLINDYRRPSDSSHLYHMDAYRLSGAREAETLDLYTYLETGALVIEWADQILDALPEDRIHIKLAWVDDNTRAIKITAHGSHAQAIVQNLIPNS